MIDWGSRSRILDDITEAAGMTPLLRLRKVAAGPQVLCGKLEFMNPTSSLKDRVLRQAVARAEERGDLRPGMTILEASTGSTGIAAAMIGAVKGYPVMIVMPEGMSEERKASVLAYGAQVVLTPGAESDVDLCLTKVQELKRENPGKFWEVAQFSNKDNIEAHYLTTGPEIWEQTAGKVDVFVASQGSGGTVSGVAMSLKEKNPRVKIYAVEPAECPILSGGGWGPHLIEGIGDGFIPDNLDLDYIDGVVTVSSQEAIAMTRRLAQEEGLFCGISSGCNVVAANKLSAALPDTALIVTMINDTGMRYFSTALFGHEPSAKIPEREHPIREEDRQNLRRRNLHIVH
ncbi:MAG: cysteine synthase family protein [Deltaproteobacteria bacterium]|nr:cysteine synthase family protein [Deltaproteobacteria bacterium]